MLRKIVFLGLMISCILGLTMAGPAQAAIIPNGDFETGDFTGWNAFGNTGVIGFPFNIDGTYSGYINSQGSIGNVCSWLYSDNVVPVYVPRAVQVSFKVRYNTLELITPTQYDDPFHAVLKFNEGNGDVTLVTISPNAVSAGPGFGVQNLATGTFLPARSNPPWLPTAIDGWFYSSDVLLVSGTIPYTSCDSVNIRFDICSAIVTGGESLGVVDDVNVTFVNAPGASTTWWKFAPNAPVLCP